MIAAISCDDDITETYDKLMPANLGRARLRCVRYVGVTQGTERGLISCCLSPCLVILSALHLPVGMKPTFLPLA